MAGVALGPSTWDIVLNLSSLGRFSQELEVGHLSFPFLSVTSVPDTEVGQGTACSLLRGALVSSNRLFVYWKGVSLPVLGPLQRVMEH